MDSKKFKELTYSGSFCEGISPILFGAQIFGIFPLKGIHPKPSSNVRFSWFSLSSLMGLVFITYAVGNVLLHVYTSRYAKVLDILFSCDFFLVCLLVYLLFLRLAMKWSEIIKWWTKREQPFLESPYTNRNSKTVKSKLIRVATALVILGVGEHCLSLYESINFYIQLYTQCNVSNVGFKGYMFRRFGFEQFYFPGMTSAIVSQLMNWCATVAWNFLDLFIILVCVGINFRFEQFNSALKYHLKHEIPTPKSMLKFRMDFIALCELLEYIDKHMGILIFLSVFNDVNSICRQLMKAFNLLRFFSDYLYYWLSLLYLILRTFYLFLCAASINDNSRVPIRLLHNISKTHWNQECYRLLFQINSTQIALTAMGFFDFTRGLILTMAGAIVTFELVVMQFSEPINTLTPLCEMA